MESLKTRIVLYAIFIGKKLFYNTPIHRSKLVNFVYEKSFHVIYKPGNIITVRYNGSDFRVPTTDITILPSLLTNNYEKLELKMLQTLLKPSMNFVDAGANIGIHTITAARSIGDMGRVFSFEPESENFRLLTENVQANKCHNVTLINSALGDKKGKLNLFLAKNSIGTHTLIDDKKVHEKKTVQVDITTLDEYLSSIKQKIDIMKIDVEGFEPKVIEGAKSTLKNVRYLFFEFSKTPIFESVGISNFLQMLIDFPYLYNLNEHTNKIEVFSLKDFQNAFYANILATKEQLL